ncbi:hypothetical protein HRbin30_02318 [bacterium HR30]|nr:hypothetical protein HRbin30_02318 [bacterium HR30]
MPVRKTAQAVCPSDVLVAFRLRGRRTWGGCHGRTAVRPYRRR